MKIITFTGWGQQADSLSSLIPEWATAQHIHYQHFEGYRELLPFLKGKECDILIGWSLGGQIALRAVSEKILQPRLLVLLATPFEFLSSEINPFGRDITEFNHFERDFYNNPIKTHRKFTLLMNKHDTKAATLNKELPIHQPPLDNWLIWLRELKYFSCAELKLSHAPRTLIFHGEKDVVVNCEQAHLLQQSIPDSAVTLLEDASHMPHKHAPFMLRNLIIRAYQDLEEEENYAE